MENILGKREGILSMSEQEFIKSQFEQSMETYRTQLTLLSQLTAVLVIANATVVGYAISSQKSGILLIGPLFPIMILCIAHSIFRLMVPVIYTAVSLEHKYGAPHIDFLATTFLSISMSTEYVDELKAISMNQDPVERIRQLRGVTRPLLGSGRNIVTTALVLVALGQFIAPVILSLLFKWRFF